MKILMVRMVLFLLASGHVYAEPLDDAPPYYAEFTAPVYPEAEKPYQTEGAVAAILSVGISGAVESVEITESSPKGVFDQAILDAIKQWKFRPRCKGGFEKPFHVTKKFKIQKGPYVGAKTEIVVEANIHEPKQNLKIEGTSSSIQLRPLDPCAGTPVGEFTETGASAFFPSPSKTAPVNPKADTSVFRSQ